MRNFQIYIAQIPGNFIQEGITFCSKTIRCLLFSASEVKGAEVAAANLLQKYEDLASASGVQSPQIYYRIKILKYLTVYPPPPPPPPPTY